MSNTINYGKIKTHHIQDPQIINTSKQEMGTQINFKGTSYSSFENDMERAKHVNLNLDIKNITHKLGQNISIISARSHNRMGTETSGKPLSINTQYRTEMQPSAITNKF